MDLTVGNEIQCHECGVFSPLFVCPCCRVVKSVPVSEAWGDLDEQILALAVSAERRRE